MGKIISHGAPDEFFNLPEFGSKLDVATLIDRVNATPLDELDIREVATVDLIEAASRNLCLGSSEISEDRMEEPILLLALPWDGEWQDRVVDGTHRLRARAAAGKMTTRRILVPPALAQGLIEPWAGLWGDEGRRSRRR